MHMIDIAVSVMPVWQLQHHHIRLAELVREPASHNKMTRHAFGNDDGLVDKRLTECLLQRHMTFSLLIGSGLNVDIDQ